VNARARIHPSCPVRVAARWNWISCETKIWIVARVPATAKTVDDSSIFAMARFKGKYLGDSVIVCVSSASIDVKSASCMSFQILTVPSEDPVANVSDPGRVAILVTGCA
jgi:hypothetical protein